MISMLFEIISLVIGISKILVYKLLYFTRISFINIPRLNKNFKIVIKKKSKLCFGIKFRARNNVSFRIYNEGVVKIGDNCFFNDNCSINCLKSITIGNNVIFGQNVMIFDHDHDYKNDLNMYITDEIKIGNNVWIGANCVILKGVTIGDNVVVGAGSIINKSIDSNTLFFQKRSNEERRINL